MENRDRGSLRGVHADVAGTVELGLDLADFGGDQLIVIDQRVLAAIQKLFGLSRKGF